MSSLIRADARVDGVTDANAGRVALRISLDEAGAEFLEFVAAGCLVQVIRLEDLTVGAGRALSGPRPPAAAAAGGAERRGR